MVRVVIAEFAYCGAMYKDAVKVLDRKFGQPLAVVSADLEKLSIFLPLKVHNSESLISYSAKISALVGVFRSLHYHQDFSSASLLDQATHKLPPNLRETWPMHTVKNWDRLTLLELNDWLEDEADAHETMKWSSGKPKIEDSNPPAIVMNKDRNQNFCVHQIQSKTVNRETDNRPTNFIACKENHPLWHRPVFHEKTPTQRPKLVADKRLCFSCFNGQNSFRKCPEPRKCLKQRCSSTHITLLYGSEKNFQKNVSKGLTKSKKLR